MEPGLTDGAGTPTRWLIAFRRTTEYRWVRWLAWGTYKHVRAFGYVADCGAYVFYDVGWGKTTIALARGEGARALMLEWTRDADVLTMPPAGQFVRLPPVFCCTTAVRHLIGLPGGALRPDRLYADCLAHGAEIVHGKASRHSEDRSDAGCSALEGRAG